MTEISPSDYEDEQYQLQFQSFLKTNFLPSNYNSIEDYHDSWILLKKTNLIPKFSFPFKEILIVFCQDVSLNYAKILSS